MRERPILFNTEMVRSILDSRKTCTRRVIKFPDGMTGHPIGKAGDSSNPLGVMYPGGIKRPPYQPGDILYVRETFAWCPCWDCGLDTTPDGCKNPVIYDSEKKEHGCYMYRASCEDSKYSSADTWHPSIHMPKEAARIWLKVTDVRVERLQEITMDDCHREGINIATSSVTDGETLKRNHDFSLEKFETLWNSTIKKSDLDRYGWDVNPWVWVVEFERCEKPGKE